MSEKDMNIYYCVGHGCVHPKRSFYVSYNTSHGNGTLPFCKEFIKDKVYNIDNNVNLFKFQSILRQLDIPFLQDTYDRSLATGKDVVGQYFREFNSLPQNRGLVWNDSIFLAEELHDDEDDDIASKKPSDLTHKQVSKMENKWGFGYTSQEYILFERKWSILIDNYGQKTSMHVEGLMTYIRFRVKEELSTAQGNVTEAKQWGGLASKAATDAKINVSQLSKSDISGGIDVLPQLFEAVESKVGVISQLPKVLDQPYDDVDIVLWSNINYIRRLEGKDRVPYRKVWDFYDDMIDEHCEQQGLNKKQTEEFKKTRRVPYKDLGEVYREPVYEDGDV